jgi:hypothetical protein
LLAGWALGRLSRSMSSGWKIMVVPPSVCFSRFFVF